MASGRGRSSRMKFFEQHTFGKEHADPLEVDKRRVCENVSAESANIRGVAPSKISYARKRRFSDLEFVQDEGTSMELQRFDDEAIGVGEVSKDAELCSEADMRNVRSSSRGQALYQRSRQGVLTKYNDDGDDEFQCIYCDANFWLPEANKRNKRNAPIIYTSCCQNGRVKLEQLKPTPAFLEELLNPINGRESILFRQNIRVYNSMFAYTSMVPKLITMSTLMDLPLMFSKYVDKYIIEWVQYYH